MTFARNGPSRHSRASFENSARRAGNNFPRRSSRRFWPRPAPVRDNGHSFDAHFAAPGSRGGGIWKYWCSAQVFSVQIFSAQVFSAFFAALCRFSFFCSAAITLLLHIQRWLISRGGGHGAPSGGGHGAPSAATQSCAASFEKMAGCSRWMQLTGRCGKAIELRWLLRETNSAPEGSKRWPKMSRFNCTQYGKANGDFKLSHIKGTLRDVQAAEACATAGDAPSFGPPSWRQRTGLWLPWSSTPCWPRLSERLRYAARRRVGPAARARRARPCCAAHA